MKTVAQRAEALDYDTVWVSDFIDWNRMQDRYHLSSGSAELVTETQVPLYHEALTNLAWVAGLTERVRLGVAILCLPYRNPIVAAKQIANVDVLSGGRFLLGVGPGGSKSGHNRNFEVLGVPRSDKYPRMTDYMRAMLAIWTQKVSSYQGEFISFPETEFYPKPVQKPHPPIWGGGWAARSIDFLAEFCTGWVPGWVSAAEYPARIEEIRALARAKGRGDVDFVIGTEIFAAVDRTHERAYELSRRTFAALPLGFQTNPPEEKIRRSSLVGSAEEVREQVERFVKSGVRHFELKFIYHSIGHLLEQMELFRAEVMRDFLQ
jgi:probable F420-dependent oxidoreductase